MVPRSRSHPHSGTQLGLTTAARFLPILIFGQAGGLFADRRDKRRILLVTQTSAGLLAALFAVLTGTHEIRPENLANAVTLNSVAMNMARVLGAAVGGVPTLLCGLLAPPVLVSIDHRRGGRSPQAAGIRRWRPYFRPNGRVASPGQLSTERPDETSDANTTTELR